MDIEPTDVRALAVARLRKKRDLQAHLIAFVTVNAFLTGIWFATGADGFFWPMFPIFGWGIGVVFHVWDVYSPPEFSQARVEREMRRLTRHTGT